MSPAGGDVVPQAVVLDFGGVLTTPVGRSISAWLEADGIDPESFTAVLRRWLSRDAPEGTPIHRLETGELTAPEFERLLADELVVRGGGAVEPDGLLERLFAGMRPAAPMTRLVEDLRRCGTRLALLSNSWGNDYPREWIDEVFDVVVVSGEVGLRKPDPRIYRLVLDRLGLDAGQVVFVDDAEPNVLGAHAVGIPAVHHQDPQTTRRALAELIPALSAQEPDDDHPAAGPTGPGRVTTPDAQETR